MVILYLGAVEDDELAKAIMERRFVPSLITTEAWEGYTFAGLDIRIKESTDYYGAVLWPSVRSFSRLMFFNDNTRSPTSGKDAHLCPSQIQQVLLLIACKCEELACIIFSHHNWL